MFMHLFVSMSEGVHVCVYVCVYICFFVRAHMYLYAHAGHLSAFSFLLCIFCIQMYGKKGPG